MALLFSCSPVFSFMCSPNNACSDMPPSRALAIAEGRLDPISMCAFYELACTAPSTALPIPAAKGLQSQRGSSYSGSKSQEEDVWLGTNEELIEVLAPTDALPPCRPSSILAANSPYKVQIDNGFVVHLASISSSRVVAQALEEQQGVTAGNTVILSLSPGKKRVLPPLPNNKPFKRGRKLDDSSKASDITASLLSREDDGQIFSKKHTSLGKVNGSFRVHNCTGLCEPAQSGHARRGSYGSVVTGESVFKKAVGSESWDLEESFRAVQVSPHAQDMVRDDHALLGLETAVATQIARQSCCKPPSVKMQKVDIRASMMERSITSCGVESLESIRVASLPEPTTANSIEKPEAQEFERNASHQNSVSQRSCDVLLPPDALPGLVSENIQSNNVGPDNSGTDVVSKRQRKECKAKKEIRSKVVVSPLSSPGLLKFFRRAPTI